MKDLNATLLTRKSILDCKSEDEIKLIQNEQHLFIEHIELKMKQAIMKETNLAGSSCKLIDNLDDVLCGDAKNGYDLFYDLFEDGTLLKIRLYGTNYDDLNNIEHHSYTDVSILFLNDSTIREVESHLNSAASYVEEQMILYESYIFNLVTDNSLLNNILDDDFLSKMGLDNIDLRYGLPKQFTVYPNTEHEETYTLGAVLGRGEGFYLSDKGGFIHSNDFIADRWNDVDELGRFIYDDLALNGLYYEIDSHGRLDSDIITMFNQSEFKILNDNMRDFVNQYTRFGHETKQTRYLLTEDELNSLRDKYELIIYETKDSLLKTFLYDYLRNDQQRELIELVSSIVLDGKDLMNEILNSEYTFTFNVDGKELYALTSDDYCYDLLTELNTQEDEDELEM